MLFAGITQDEAKLMLPCLGATRRAFSREERIMRAGQPTEYPLMNAGKAVMREGRLVMPLSIFVNHAFVDGAHISRFFKLVEECLKRISA